MPSAKPSNNRRGAAHHNPDQQPSLLDQLELDEEHAPQKQAPEDHQPEDPRHESPNQEDGDARRTEATDKGTEVPPPAEHEEQTEHSDEHKLEPLQRAYARYVEIVNDTYCSTFSDTRRQAAFREAAKAHGVRITDLKRYSTAAALSIPYRSEAEHGTDVPPSP